MSEKFKRQMWWLKKLGKSWRRPRGKQNKLRQEMKGKGRLPTVGYGSPAAERGKHPSGMYEFMVFNVADVARADAKHAIRIAGSVGTRKRLDIMKACKTKGLTVLNPGKKTIEMMNQKADKKEAKT
ncbi:MAG: 50S ribosomal protein L32e [Candidatus Aenigmatarchaeota archaeon]|nr:MAG: 50S ribosomal protein L32e [Candidatus Aenigmarchaeota archaeon]